MATGLAAGSAVRPSAGPQRRWLRLLVLAGAPVGLALVGTQHPGGLNADTADGWFRDHLIAMWLFPLVAAGPWLLLGPAAPGLRRVVVPAVRVLLFGYAVAYTALDLIAGVAAGYVVRTARDRGTDVGPAKGYLYEVGDALGWFGASLLLVALVALVLLLAHEARVGAAPVRWLPLALGAVLVVLAGALFIESHIFMPEGVLTMLLLAAGLVLLDLARPSAEPVRSP